MQRILILIVFIISFFKGLAYSQEPLQPKQVEEQKITESEIRAIIQKQGAKNWAIRKNATKKLISLGEPAVPFLIEAMSASDSMIRRRSKQVLVTNGYWQKVPSLITEKNLIRQSFNIANSITAIREKAKAFSSVAIQYADAGFKTEAVKTLQKAFLLVKNRKNFAQSYNRDELVFEIAKSWAEIDEYEQSINTLKNLTDLQRFQQSIVRGILIAYVIRRGELYHKALLWSKDCQGKRQVIQAITDILITSRQYDKYLELFKNEKEEIKEVGKGSYTIVYNLINDKQYDKALQIANNIKDTGWRDGALTTIAKEYLEKKQYEEAKNLIDLMTYVSCKEKILDKLHTEYTSGGQRDKALEILIQIIRLVKSAKVSDFGGGFADCAKWKINIVTKFLDAMDIKENSTQEVSSLLSRLLEVVKSIGPEGPKWCRAIDVWTLKHRIKVPEFIYWKTCGLLRVARKYAENGEYNSDLFQAIKTLKAEDLQRPDYLKDDTLMKISDSYAENTQYDTALQIAKTIKNDEFKQTALSNITSRMHKNK